MSHGFVTNALSVSKTNSHGEAGTHTLSAEHVFPAPGRETRHRMGVNVYQLRHQKRKERKKQTNKHPKQYKNKPVIFVQKSNKLT